MAMSLLLVLMPHTRLFSSGSNASIDQLLSRIENITHGDSSPGGLSRINLLLEATMLLHSHLPLDAVLGTMLDHAMAVTDAERGLLLEADESGSLRMRLARGHCSLRFLQHPDDLLFTKSAPFHGASPLAVLYPEKLSFAWTKFRGAGQIRCLIRMAW
jgi:hypothetical protein